MFQIPDRGANFRGAMFQIPDRGANFRGAMFAILAEGANRNMRIHTQWGAMFAILAEGANHKEGGPFARWRRVMKS